MLVINFYDGIKAVILPRLCTLPPLLHLVGQNIRDRIIEFFQREIDSILGDIITNQSKQQEQPPSPIVPPTQH